MVEEDVENQEKMVVKNLKNMVKSMAEELEDIENKYFIVCAKSNDLLKTIQLLFKIIISICFANPETRPFCQLNILVFNNSILYKKYIIKNNKDNFISYITCLPH